MKLTATTRTCIVGAILTMLALMLFIITMPVAPNPTQQAIGGKFDLTGWTASTSQPIPLNGEWEFYWGKLLGPEDFGNPGIKPEMTGYIRVPSLWKGQVGGVPLTSHGYATYRLVVNLDPSPITFGIKVENIRTGHTLFVNRLAQGNSGQPAADKTAGYIPGNSPYVTYFTVNGDKAEIIVQVANFSYIDSGIALPVFFGSQAAIQALERKQVFFELIVVTTMFCLGFYHLGVYFYRRTEKSLLWFGLFGLSFCVIELTHGQRLFSYFFPQVPFESMYRAKSFSLFFSAGMMALFLKDYLKELLASTVLRYVALIFVGYSFLVPFMPINAVYYGEQVFSLLAVVAYVFYISIIVRLYSRSCYGSIGRMGLIFLFIALTGLLGSLIISMLYLNTNISSRVWADICVLICSIAMSYMLALRFAAAYATIENLADKLIVQDKLKDAFLVSTSHEFKTPLHGIINIAQSLLEETKEVGLDRQQENITLILVMAKRLSVLVNDILDFEKIRMNQLHLSVEAVNPSAVTDMALEVFLHITAGKQINLMNDIPQDIPPVLADADRLGQVMYNLIGNAVKFTTQGTVRITAVVNKEQAVISVIDNGIGIPEEKHETIFQPFEQVNGESQHSYGGTGLGLAICKQLVEKMGGQIWVDASQPGQGTTITFTLPLAAAGIREASLDSAVPKEFPHTSLPTLMNGGEFTLLAVDDEVVNLQVISNIFNQENYNIISVANGAEALLEIEKNSSVDLVLLDVMMPGISGYEVCRQIRKRYSLLELPIVLVTVLNRTNDIEAGFKAGANDYIVKPFEAEEIRVRVRTLLELKKAVRNAVRAEMAFLQSQIKPHFFYNTLNTIVSLCYTDAPKAGRLLAEFSNYLRRSFDIRDTLTLISLEKELELVRSYVAIENARFSDKIIVDYSIDSSILEYKVLPLIIQPIVENAIRHGILPQQGSGIISVQARKKEAELIICIADNGVGMSEAKRQEVLSLQSASGVGLANIHRRLLRMQEKGLSIESAEGQGTTITIRLSLRSINLREPIIKEFGQTCFEP